MQTYTPVVCVRCGRIFPRSSQKPTQRYCSHACANGDSLLKQAELRAKGLDPVHGGEAAKKRAVALVRRRAAGELLGRQAQRAKREQQGSMESTKAITPCVAEMPARPETLEQARILLGAGPHLTEPPDELAVHGPATPSFIERDGQEYLEAGIR
jgi:hypothetical protein